MSQSLLPKAKEKRQAPSDTSRARIPAHHQKNNTVGMTRGASLRYRMVSL